MFRGEKTPDLMYDTSVLPQQCEAQHSLKYVCAGNSCVGEGGCHSGTASSSPPRPLTLKRGGEGGGADLDSTGFLLTLLP